MLGTVGFVGGLGRLGLHPPSTPLVTCLLYSHVGAGSGWDGLGLVFFNWRLMNLEARRAARGKSLWHGGIPLLSLGKLGLAGESQFPGSVPISVYQSSQKELTMPGQTDTLRVTGFGLPFVLV